MAFDPSDSALDALDEADPQVRRQFLERLSEDERATLSTAIPGWRQRKAQRVQGAQTVPSAPGMDASGASTPGSPMQPGRPVGSPPPINPATAAAVSQNLPAAPGYQDPNEYMSIGNPVQYQEVLPHPKGKFGEFEGVAESIPGIRADIHALAMKGANAQLEEWKKPHVSSDPNLAVLDPASKGMDQPIVSGPKSEYAARIALSNLGGQEVMDQMPDDVRYKADRDLESALGGSTKIPFTNQTVGGVVLATLSAAGQIVTDLTTYAPVGKLKALERGAQAVQLGAKAIPLVKQLPHLAAEAVHVGLQGGALNAGKALFAGEDPGQSFLQGFLLTTALHGTGAGGKILGSEYSTGSVKGDVEFLGNIVKNKFANIRESIGDGLHLNSAQYRMILESVNGNPTLAKMAENEAILEGKMAPRRLVKPNDPTFKPSGAQIVDDGAGGLKAVILDFNVKKPTVAAEMPMNTYEDVVNFKKYAERKDIHPNMSPDINSKLPTDHYRELMATVDKPKLTPEVQEHFDKYGTTDLNERPMTEAQIAAEEKKIFLQYDQQKDAARLKKKQWEQLQAERGSSPPEKTPGARPRNARKVTLTNDLPEGADQGSVKMVIDEDGHVGFSPDKTPAIPPGATKENAKVSYGGRRLEEEPGWIGKEGVEGEENTGVKWGVQAPDYSKFESSIKTEPVRGYIKETSPSGEVSSRMVERVGRTPDGASWVRYKGEGQEPFQVGPGEFHPRISVQDALSLDPQFIVKADTRVRPDDITPDQISAKSVEDNEFWNGTMGVLVRRNPKLASRILESGTLMDKSHYGPQNFIDVVRAKNAVDTLRATKADVQKSLMDAAKKDGVHLSQVSKDLDKVFEGKMDWSEFSQKNPQSTQQLIDISKNFMSEVEANHKQLIQLGMLPEGIWKNEGEKFKYLTKMYWRDTIGPGKWQKVMPQQAWDNMADEIAKSLEKSGDHWDQLTVQTELERIMRAEDPNIALKNSAFASTKKYGSMLKRGEHPDVFKKFIGEVDDGFIRMAHTIGEQRGLVGLGKMYEKISEDPRLYSHGPQPHLYHEPVPNNPRLYGKVAGGYVSPEIYESVVMMPKAVQNGNKLIKGFVGFVKGNQVALGGPIPIGKSIAENLVNTVVTGGIDPIFRPHEMGSILEAGRAMRDYHTDASGKTGLGGLILEMKARDVTGNNFMSQEVSNAGTRAGWKVLDRLGKENHTNAFTFFEKMKHYTWDQYRGLASGVGHYALEMPDDFFKVANYIGLKKKFLKAPERWLPGVAPERLNDAAADKAARWVNESFPNMAHIGTAQKAFRDSGAGVLAPYGVINSENARNIAFIPKRIKEDPMAAARIAAWGLAVGVGVYVNNLRNAPHAAAIESAKAQVKDSAQAFHPGPMTCFWQENGQPFCMDASQYLWPAQFLQGHPDDSVFNRVGAEVIKFPFKGGWLEPSIQKSLESVGMSRPVMKDPKLIEGQGNLLNGLKEAARAALLPGFVNWGMKAYDRTQPGPLYTSPPPQSVGSSAAKALLGPAVVGELNPTDPRGLMDNAKEYADLQKQLRYVYLMRADTVAQKAERDRLTNAILTRIKVLAGKMQERGNLRGKARQESGK